MTDGVVKPKNAASVMLIRPGNLGLEILFLRRNPELAFQGDHWVFPGGRIDPDDTDAERPHDESATAQRAAVREASEEAGVSVPLNSLVYAIHWTTPVTSPIRFSTSFFIAPAPLEDITIDGNDIRDVTQESLARQTAMVLQEPFLFSGTIAENIAYSNIDADHDDIVAAAKTVGAHQFIERMSAGYDTQLEERGQNLSVGQRQLLSFARALIADPAILILDEATANIDSYSESVIQQAMTEVFQGRTSIVIAHRLSTIRNADKIIMLEHGEILEQGTHDELLVAAGAYAQLYSTYFVVDSRAK